MAIHHFNKDEALSQIDRMPDFRSDIEKVATPLQLYDHDKPDIAYAERLGEEIVNISGAWVRVHIRTDQPADDVHDEDADPQYADGVDMKAYLAPAPLEQVLTKWGIDINNTMKITFSRAAIIKKWHHRGLRIGDIIEVPYNGLAIPQGEYRVLNAADTGNFQYRWLYITCNVENISGDRSVKIAHNAARKHPK